MDININYDKIGECSERLKLVSIKCEQIHKNIVKSQARLDSMVQPNMKTAVANLSLISNRVQDHSQKANYVSRSINESIDNYLIGDTKIQSMVTSDNSFSYGANNKVKDILTTPAAVSTAQISTITNHVSTENMTTDYTTDDSVVSENWLTETDSAVQNELASDNNSDLSTPVSKKEIDNLVKDDNSSSILEFVEKHKIPFIGLALGNISIGTYLFIKNKIKK